MKYKIYKITNIINNKCYIGFTKKNLQQRFKEHIYESFNKKCAGYNYIIHKSIRKYGENCFNIDELFCSWDRDYCLKEMEKYFITEYNSYVGWENSNGYNQTLGGQAAMLGKTHSTKSKLKMSQNHNHQKPMMGKIHSEESKLKMSSSRKKLKNVKELSSNAGKISQQNYKNDPVRQKIFSERMKLWWKERKEQQGIN